MKRYLLTRLPRRVLDFAASLRMIWRGDLLKLRRLLEDEQRRRQMLAKRLVTEYSSKGNAVIQQTAITQHELSVYSQNGEDGILLYLFDLLGTHNKTFVEFGVGNGQECNSALLSLHFGWQGLLMEADRQSAAKAGAFYQQSAGDVGKRVRVEHAKVSAENINSLLTQFDTTGEIDLLSIDIDSVDLWIWKAITAVKARIVVIEYNAVFGAQQSVTVPYQQAFHDAPRAYHGASLLALETLGKTLGYKLVCTDTAGVNAFFVRNDVAGDKIEAMSTDRAFHPPLKRSWQPGSAELLQSISHLPLETIE